ncbi:ATPase, AAA-type, core domain protein [Candidatus Magnetomorum sp. HK-1]|nr:ATPase, AAA-type, core domain protein [Candidatus Magnetomorum sp. HK-1]
MKFFNTAGPVNCDMNYCLLPLTRFDLEEIEILIDQHKYFILHAPRQTGKTSCMLALMKHLNIKGMTCLYINVESAQAMRENVKEALTAILSEIASRTRSFLKSNYLEDIWYDIITKRSSNALNEILTRWAEMDSQPKVLIIDEIDSLIGDTLISVLRQLRSGYDKRPQSFPQSIILCGIRDVRDYRIHSSSEKTIITGGSAFNIKAKSLRLGDFTKAEIITLYQQHTHMNGQVFTDEAFEAAWLLSEGQPWLVNALANEVTFEMKEMRDPTIKITEDHMQEAGQNLIRRRETHLDQLVDKLAEERVQKVIEPILLGIETPEKAKEDDILYVMDLGLIKIDPKMRIANKIYQEVIPRALTFSTQVTISQETSWYIRESDGTIDFNKLMHAFQDFFRKHSEKWQDGFQYREASVQLLLQAFLQRIINNGGYIFREYGLGKKRTDLLIIWHKGKQKQEVVVELKIRRSNTQKTIQKGVQQTWNYMDKCGASEGHLVIFDQRKSKSWKDKIFMRKEQWNGSEIMVWGM